MTLKELRKQMEPGKVYPIKTKEQIGEYPVFDGCCWIKADGSLGYGRMHTNSSDDPAPRCGIFKTDKELEPWEINLSKGYIAKDILELYNREKKKLEAGEPLDR
jgi:hypothetical protein